MFCKNILIKRKKTLVTKCHHSKVVTSKNSIIFHKNCNIRQEIDFAVNLLLNLKPQYFVPREGLKKKKPKTLSYRCVFEKCNKRTFLLKNLQSLSYE